MRKFLAVCVSMLLLTACGPAPNANGTGTGTGTDTGTGTGANASGNATASKSAYIAALTCIKNKTPDANQKAAIDANIAAVNAVPDTTWAAVSASLTVSYSAWLQAIGGSCN